MADNEIHRMMGQVQAGIESLKSSITEIKNETRANATEIRALSETLSDIKPIAEDWAATKKRGVLVLAGVGASGLAAGYGFKPAAAWIKTVFLGG